MKKRTYIILAICLLVAVTAACFYFRMKKSSKEESPDAGTIAGSTTTDVLSEGSRGEDVKKLQRYLNNCLLTSPLLVKPTYQGEVIEQLVVDGIFGARTKAVCQWKFGKTSINISEIQ